MYRSYYVLLCLLSCSGTLWTSLWNQSQSVSACLTLVGRCKNRSTKHQGDTVINLKMKQPSPAVHSGWSGIPEAALILPARMWGLPIVLFARTEGQNGSCHSTVAKRNPQTFQNKSITAWSAWGSVDVGRKRWLKFNKLISLFIRRVCIQLRIPQKQSVRIRQSSGVSRLWFLMLFFLAILILEKTACPNCRE